MTACPTCGTRAEDGQLVCLECGSRVALDYRRPPSWRVPVAIVVAVLLMAIGGTAFALKTIGDDAERDVSRTPVKTKDGKGDSKAPAKEAPAKK
jgi:DNA-directed RNA polymerase subunit RPC12/RpoP